MPATSPSWCTQPPASGRRSRPSSRARPTWCARPSPCCSPRGTCSSRTSPAPGKTMLAKTLAKSLDCSVRRIQFTPDLLPGDVTGVSVFNQETRDFEFRPGAVFANIVLGDEINRASPKTQSALLECMEERQVTVDGTTYELAVPVHGDRDAEPGRDGGHLPAARGAARPVHGARVDGLPGHARPRWTMLAEHAAANPLDDITPVADAALVSRLVDVVRTIHVAAPIRQYAVDISQRDPRSTPTYGSAPRRARRCTWSGPPRPPAALDDRDHVLPDDLQNLAALRARAPADPHGRRPDRRPHDGDGRRRRPAARRRARRRRGTERRGTTRCGRHCSSSPGAVAWLLGAGIAGVVVSVVARAARPPACRRPAGRPAAAVGPARRPHALPPRLRPRPAPDPRGGRPGLDAASCASRTSHGCPAGCCSSRTRCRGSSDARSASCSTGSSRAVGATCATSCAG